MDQTCTLPTMIASTPPNDQMHRMAASVTPPSIARFRFTEAESLVARSHQACAVTQKPPGEEPPPGFFVDLKKAAQHMLVVNSPVAKARRPAYVLMQPT
jgi:hypothetical protein